MRKRPCGDPSHDAARTLPLEHLGNLVERGSSRHDVIHHRYEFSRQVGFALERTADISGPLLPWQGSLCRAVTIAAHDRRRYPQPEFVCDQACQFRGLVESALAEAGWCEWHWQHKIGIRFLLQGLCKAGRKGASKRQAVAILQSEYKGIGGESVAQGASNMVICRRLAQAASAGLVGRIGKRADRAARDREAGQRRSTAVAQAVRCRQIAAERAGRCQQAVRCFPTLVKKMEGNI